MHKINLKAKEKIKKIYKLSLKDDENDNNNNNNIENSKISNNNSRNNNNNNNIIRHKKSLSISNRQIKNVNFSEDISNENENNSNLNISLFEEFKNDNTNTSIKIKIKEFCNNVIKLMKQKVYIFCVLAVAVFNFISTAIQYWVSDHLSKVMKFEENEIFVSFVITCVTAPALGVISGGYIVQKLGGYEHKRSILICLLFSIIASINGIFIVIPDSIVGFSIVLWIYLFFGGAIIPNLIGKII